MLAGYAEIDITPPPGEELTGYGYYLNRRARGALDPLMARAVALSDGHARAVLVQLDLLGLSHGHVDDIRSRAHQCLGLAPQGLLLHCTHTHTGPAVAHMEGCGTPSPYYPEELTGRVLEVVGRALEDLREAASPTRWAADFPAGFAWNRTGAEEVDTWVRGVEIPCSGAAPIMVISYACHPVTLGRLDQYSADYPGHLLRELNAYGVRALYLNGCCGDIDPASHRVRWGAGTVDTLRVYGRDLASVVRRAAARAQAWEPGPVQVLSRRIPVPHQPLDPEQLDEDLRSATQQVDQHPEDGSARVRAAWCRRMLDLHAAGAVEEAMRAEVQAIACGDVVWAGLASEAFTRLGRIVRDAAPERHVIVAGTCNGVLGYLGTPEDARRGGYASGAAARIYGMALPTPDAGVEWARQGGRVVRQAAGLEG